MRVIIGYFLICFLFAFPFVLYRTLYFKKVACISVSFDNGIVFSMDSLLPTRRTFKNLAKGLPYSFVSLGNGVCALYVSKPGAEDPLVSLNGVSFSSPVYVFQRSRFGRFCSIDFSKRFVVETIKKFKSEV